MLDLSEYPVVDSHCHAFLPEKETEPFEQYLNLADHPLPKADIESTLLYRGVVRELSRFFGVDGTRDEVIEERMRRYRQDPAGHIMLLFEDAKIETLLVDTGYPAEIFSGYSIGLEDFSKMVPCEVREIFRIDIVIYDLVKNQLPFESAVNELHERIGAAVKGGAVALKSVVAYRTGLEIKRHGEGEVRRAYGELIAESKAGKSVRSILSGESRHAKTAYDHFVFLGVEDSVWLGVPFQLHTGMGDAPSIDLRVANPTLLRDLINDGSTKEARIVLTHGGYPYVEEAGFLVSTYPNVFMDLSETIPFAGVGVKDKLLGLLAIAPTNKLMYGSDGFNIPELHWFSSIQAKKVLSYALKELMEFDKICEDDAREIAKRFLSENARRIYEL
jgi:hypothetical protein